MTRSTAMAAQFAARKRKSSSPHVCSTSSLRASTVSVRTLRAAVGAALCFWAFHGSAQPFRAAFHDPPRMFLLDNDQRIYLRAGARPLEFQAVLRGVVLPSEVTSFARWRSEWMVVVGMDTLYVFAANGEFLKSVHLPNFAFSVDARANTMWFYNALSVSTATSRLWWSRDLRQLTPVNVKLVDESLPSRDGLLAASSVMSACDDDTLTFAHVIGEAELEIIGHDGVRREFALQYSRTAERDKRRKYIAPYVSPYYYSAPVRDVLCSGHTVAVLRNWEDVKTSKGVIAQRARVADVYSRDGRHLGTATFTNVQRWLWLVNPATVCALSASGESECSSIGPPMPSQIIQAPFPVSPAR